ncbi:MAG: DUF3301 domain-containing protein [Gammaproteobacteria bacterium]|nr:DUF3301 domain-containing protein [Gammaproteobacteria bacterium]
MTFSLNAIWPLLLLLVVVYIWFEILRIRELVIRHCKRLCQEANLQLLDQTVALSSLSFKRGGNGMLLLQRVYCFEVSENGVERLAGFITLRGNYIIESRLEAADGSNIIHQQKFPTLH